jgi:prophage DNA circulation protein
MASHSVSNGGGVLGAVNLYTATLAYARPLSRVWGFSMAAMYDNSKSISHQVNQYWNAATGMINFTRKIGESWNASAYLLFIHQTQNFYGTPGTSSAAGLGLTLHYIWGHPLAR